jgi:hypothetical protein
MKAKLLSKIAGRQEWALIFDPGDEVMTVLKSFAEKQNIFAAHFTGIGAFAEVKVAWFDLETKKYQPININEQVEVVSLTGDIAESDEKPSVHAHICVAKRDGTAHGGHLLSGHVRPTLELIVVESPVHLRKTFRPQFGIALIDLEQSSSGKP